MIATGIEEGVFDISHNPLNLSGSRALSECLNADLYDQIVATSGRSSGRFIFRSERLVLSNLGN